MKCGVHGEVTITVINWKRAETRLVLVHGDVGDETVVSHVDRFGKTSLQK